MQFVVLAEHNKYIAYIQCALHTLESVDFKTLNSGILRRAKIYMNPLLFARVAFTP